MQPDVNVITLPRFDPTQGRVERLVTAGSSIGEIVAVSLDGLSEEHLRCARVTIGDQVIPFENWQRVHPKSGTTVMVRAIPGNNVLRNVLTVAATVAAVSLGQFYLGPALLTAGFSTAAAGITTSLATGALPVSDTLIVDGLAPLAG